MADQQRATGRARVVVTIRGEHRTATVTLSRGDEIGYAVGAMNAAGIPISAARPGRLTVELGRRRYAVVAEALRAVGFAVEG